MAYSFQGSHNGQENFCNWLADGSTTGKMWLALRAFKSINVDFLNQIDYFSIKKLLDCPRVAEWAPLLT